MTTAGPGRRERKKQATREALRTAALRLALEKGPDNVRVDEIADAAGVSPRTYNNYFASREQAIIAAVTAERESRIASAVLARAADVGLGAAVVDAVIEQYTQPGGHPPDVLLMITTSPALQAGYAETVAGFEESLAAALVERVGGLDRLSAEVLAAGVGAAARVALRRWMRPAAPAAGEGLVLVSGSLPDLLRAALAPLVPSLDAAAAAGG